MPKRAYQKPLADAFFALDDVATQLWSQIESILADFQEIASLKAPDFPQEPDETKLAILKDRETLYKRLPSDNGAFLVSHYRQEVEKDQGEREAKAKQEWLRPFYTTFSAQHVDWHLRLFNEALATGTIQPVCRLDQGAARKAFLFWRKPPKAWSWAGTLCPEPGGEEMPHFDSQGELAKSLLDSVHRVKPMPAPMFGTNIGYLFDGSIWELGESERHFDEEEIRLLILIVLATAASPAPNASRTTANLS